MRFFAKWKSVSRNVSTSNSPRNGSRSAARISRTFLLAGALLSTLPPLILAAQDATFKIPPQKIPFTFKDQQAYIVASATVSMLAKTSAAQTFRLQLTADLSGLQENLTPLLAAQLDKDDKCGERIAIQQATLTPAPPAAVATVQLHYERFACVKAFGKQQAKRLVAGNAVVPIRMTPAVEQDNTQLRLNPEVGEIQADGSLGELLHNGSLGDMIREKIRDSILNAMQKGANLSATLPPAAQPYATIASAQFQDAGGHLAVQLVGEIRVPREQLQAVTQQLKSRAAAAAR
ncbi:MAG TPA: hypothetical protein VIH74_06350 [Candidatus Acidoferrum sp.]